MKSTFTNVTLVAIAVATVLFGGHMISEDLRGIKTEPVLDHALAMIAILAGLVAVYFEVKLHGDFDTQRSTLDKNFEIQQKRIQTIASSMPTRYVGIWPDHLTDIMNLVEKAQRGDELLILVDHVGYGHYSRPEAYGQYVRQLEHARTDGVSIRILLYAEEPAINTVKLQFPALPEANQLGAYLDYYKDFVDKPIVDRTSVTHADFLNLALRIESSFCDRLLQPDPPHKHIEIHTIEKPASNETFFWMIRRADISKEMVFAYPKFEGGKTGHAFSTQEPKLLDLFYFHFEELWNSTRPLLHGSELFPNGYKAVGKTLAGQAAAAATAAVQPVGGDPKGTTPQG